MSVVDVYERAAGVRLYTKADLTRALVAQQWAVACALTGAANDLSETPLAAIGAKCARACVRDALPCAADLVEELLR